MRGVSSDRGARAGLKPVYQVMASVSPYMQNMADALTKSLPKPAFHAFHKHREFGKSLPQASGNLARALLKPAIHKHREFLYGSAMSLSAFYTAALLTSPPWLSTFPA